MKRKLVSVSAQESVVPESTLALAGTVLKPMLAKQGGKLAKLSAGDNALTFELHRLSLTFKPQGCRIISEITPKAPNNDGEKQTFYLLDIAGHLVRLAAFKEQAATWMNAIGAIYTGTDQELALQQALASAKRIGG